MRSKLIFSILFLSLNILLNACGSPANKGSAEKTDNSTNVQTAASNSTQKDAANPNDSACYGFRRDGMKLLKSQTFAIDFEPFKKSCFVTFYGAEFSNPPLGAQVYIYKNGKEVLNFPDQFNGGNVLCWVNAVAFEDLNNDDLKDIIIIGKCGAKNDAYNENMVYINNGDDFSINKDSDSDLMDFTKTDEIKKYVQEHPSKFSK